MKIKTAFFTTTKVFCLALVVAVIFLIASACTQAPVTKTGAPSDFEIHFIDVGQADAALIICEGKTMMIDGGNAEDSDLIYAYLKKNSITHLDFIVATHAHEDHIGGLSGALNFATVGEVFSPVTEYDSKTFENFKSNVIKRGADITLPSPGDSFSLGSAKVDIIACDPEEDTNNTSIILMISYDETKFLFTGDAERAAEQAAIESGYDLKCNVLKVAHHGSDTSTTYPFLRSALPEYAVISVGSGNTYSHPHEEVLSRLKDADAKVLRTDQLGDIICKSDGKCLTFNVEIKENSKENKTDIEYILNTNSHKFHLSTCKGADDINPDNKVYSNKTRQEIISDGYDPCGNCNP